MAKAVKVLSIDGGGIRGIIPAMVLAEIERRTKKPISKLFDLVCGTSTGGILALGLTRPNSAGKPQFTADQMVSLYEQNGERIFSRSVWHKIHSVWSIADQKYPSDGIEHVLQEYFGVARLKDALTDVLITAYEIEKRFPFFFKSRHARNPKKKGYDYPMKQVARATSAAPTYFEPAKIPTGKSSGYYALIDGGVFANNPAMCGYAEIKTTHPKAEGILLLSLGTGELTRRLAYDDAKDWGLLEWAQPVLSVIFDGVSDTVDYQLKELLAVPKGSPQHYYRFEGRLDEGNDDMDDASRTNIQALKRLARKIITDNEAALQTLCSQLVA